MRKRHGDKEETMRITPILVAAFLAAGCSLALAQAGGGAAGGGAAGGASGGGAAADGGGAAAGGATGAAAGTAGGASAGSSGQSGSGVGGDQRASRSFGRFRRGDDMAPLVVPREEAPVRLRTNRERW